MNASLKFWILESFILALWFLSLASCGQGLAVPPTEPSVGTVSSASNPDGTVTVTITGSGFVTGDSVTVNGTICTNVNVISSSQLTCVLPSAAIAVTNIIITPPGGTVNATVTTTGNGTFTVPAGISSLQIQLWGAGSVK